MPSGRTLQLVSNESFTYALGGLNYVCTLFHQLSPQSIFPGIKQRIAYDQAKARKRKFAKDSLLRILDPEALIKQVAGPLKSHFRQPGKKILPALLLVSGLRVSDVYFGAVVEPVPGEPDKALITSRLKPGLRVKGEEKKAVVPLLCPFTEFKRHLDFFRAEFKNVDSSEKATGSRGKSNKQWCSEAIGNLCSNFTRPHHMRAIYAKIAYSKFGKDEHEATFVQRVLMHDTDKAAQAYSHVMIVQE